MSLEDIAGEIVAKTVAGTTEQRAMAAAIARQALSAFAAVSSDQQAALLALALWKDRTAKAARKARMGGSRGR
jgi:hypothetical protein